MSQVETLVKVLKRTLKGNGVTYAALARSLHMSEANVKRMFSTASLSITRVEAICQVV